MDRRRDRGDTTLMSVILISFLMIAAWAVISGVQAWGGRRDAQGAAAAAARAAVQVTPAELQAGGIDPGAAQQRANTVLAASGQSGSISVTDAWTVTATATENVSYAFPAPGFANSMTATATATVQRSVSGGG